MDLSNKDVHFRKKNLGRYPTEAVTCTGRSKGDSLSQRKSNKMQQCIKLFHFTFI